MQILVTVLFLIAALVKLAPVLGVISGAWLQTLYGISFDDPNLLVLMRHRALLFGIVSVLLIAAAFHPPLRTVATAAGLFSMLTYIAIVLVEQPSSPELIRAAWIDAGAAVALTTGWAIDRFALD